MPKEIRSSVTKDSGNASNDRDLQTLYKKGLPPDESSADDFNLDLKDGEDSMQRTANQINKKG